MSAAPEFNKMAGMEGTSMRYTNLPIMDVEKGADWSIDLSDSIKDIREEDGYARIYTQGQFEIEQLIKQNASEEDIAAKKEEMKTKAADYIRKRIEITVSSTADVYKNSFFKNRSVLKLFDTLIDAGVYSTDDIAEMSGGLGIEEELEPENPNEDNPNIIKPEPTIVEETEVLPETSTIKVGGEDVTAATPLNDTQQELVDNFMEGRIGPLEDNLSTTVTKDQWKKMTRRERRNNNLPVSKLGASTYYFRDDINELLADEDSSELIAMVGMKNNPSQEFYRIKFPGELKSRTITKEQLAMIPDSAILSRKVTISSYQEGEEKARRRLSNKNLEKAFGKITTTSEE